ncbi:hypothetical protein ACFQI7_21605 [Paenibacillus allorhizosphaerae]|uniref:DUF4306 domain-containing protein n=1 Tax=Paenibacillus allorhizosphaerae TaxID=2849866 RepID=A0ABM8VND0_9BACL|nr:hypothetical protein [Paenibacillus allorhizosphaerae]CAG7650967.1 hypothetical protein PAECIP111802_04850 [Paenibacillus allorhizosphaerae]
MMTFLAVIGGLVGLTVTGSAVLLGWTLYSQLKASHPANAEKDDAHASFYLNAAPHLIKWTFFDYALFALFVIGGLFLFTDLIAVFRDREAFPPYHYGYLLCGFIFTLAGMLMMAVRLVLTVSLSRTLRSASMPDHHHHPGHAEHAE